MDYKLQDLIDIGLFQTLLDRLNKLFPFPSSITDRQGNILTATAWQEVCVRFHRINPQSEKECKLSDQYISEHLHEANPMIIYRCPHGMIDCAAPITIDGKHLGNIFAGQIFLEKPDYEYFRRQSATYGFEEDAYLEAIRKVPIWNQKQLDDYLEVIKSMVDVLVSIGSEKLHQIEARQTILESEAQYKNLFESAPDAIFLADTETGIILDANYAASKLVEKPVAEIIGMHHLLLHPNRIEQHTKDTFRSHAEGGRETGEIPLVKNFIVRSDGSEIPVEILASTIRIEGKQIMQGVFRNLTNQKKAENNLRIQHDISIMLGQTVDLNLAMSRLLEMVNQLDGIDSGGIYLADHLTGNFDLAAHCGLSEQYIGQNTYFETDSANAILVNRGNSVFRSFPSIQELNVPAIIQEGLHSISIIPIIHNGKAIACFNLASHHYDETPAETKITLESIAFNLGATIVRIATENQLKENEDKYKLAFHTSPDSVNINTMDGIFVDINEGFKELMGYTKEEVIGRSSLDLNIWVIPEDRKKLTDGLKNEGRVENLESVFRAKDGTLRTALMSARIIMINNIPHILSITRDISERKKFETELIAAKDKAEESDRLKNAFLSNLSHELRTPMNGILGFSDLLNDDSLSIEERHEYISVINDSGLSLLEVITSIMDISKLDSHQLKKRIRTFNLNGQLDELLHGFMNDRIISDKSHLKVELIKALPDHLSNIISDQGKIRHILNLLLKNAAKFTTEGHIYFGYMVQKQQIRFFVKDTGKGIPTDKHTAIFERFRQEEETLSRKYGGVGLGLSIAKGLVELLDGTIGVESEVGKGSTFWFEIPLN